MTTDDTLLQADLEARSDALDVRRSFIVQAPAGSGKTELLIQRYLKLLSRVDHPEEILAITFTRKAAAEMQLRVLDALRRARAGEEPDEEHLKLTKRLAQAALQRSEELDWNLIGSPRRMRIQTLDSLNRTITRSQPLSSPDGASGMRIVTDADLTAVHEAAAIATLDWLAEPGAAADATREVLTHVDNSTWAYVSYLAAMLKTRDQWLPFIGAGQVSDEDAPVLRERFEASLRFAVVQHLEKLRDTIGDGQYHDLPPLFDYAAACLLAENVSDSPILALAGIESWPGSEPGDVGAWQGVAEMLLVRNKPQFRKSVTKAQGFPTTDRSKKDTVTGLLDEFAGAPDIAGLLNGTRSLPPVRYTDDQWSVLLALFRLLPLAVSELKRLFAEQGIADHIEVALHAGAALGSAENPGDVALLLDYKVSHILVDEMQDTSHAQYGMLEALTGGWARDDGRTLFCVGDPMQSIYRFRNAEVGQFLLARQFGIGRMQLDSLVLRRNFRSGSKLVDWFNALFPSILAPENDAMRGAVAYSAAVPAPHLEGCGETVVHPVFGVDPEEEARVGCCEVANILAANPDEELAILVRGRTQLPALLAALRRANIPYTAIEIDKLTDLPEIIDILALTRAAVHPGDRIAWLGLLRAPWIGLTWSDLHALVHSDTRSTVRELLDDPDRCARLSASGRDAIDAARGPLNQLFLPHRSSSLRQRIERCWLSLGGPGALRDEMEVENVYRFLDLLDAHATAGTLSDVAALESVLDDERVSSNLRSRVQVMTMHKAKGLEFDHVMLYGLGRKPGGGNPGVLSWFDMPTREGEGRKIISPVGPRQVVDRDPVHRYIAFTAAEKDKYEQGRLLYVACTRAKKSLHVVGNVSVSRDGDEFKPARSDSLLHLLWPALEPAYAEAFANWSGGAPQADSPTFMQPVRRQFDAPWSLPEITPPTWSTEPDVQVDTEEDVEFYWVGTEARIAGTLAHRWLQLIADGRVPLEVDASMRSVTLRWLRELGMTAGTATDVAERVELAVARTAGDERGRWLLTGDGHAELALSGLYEGEIESIVVDRVRIDDNGDHWIVDYKTSTHEGGNLPGFIDAEVTRYTPQLQKYAAIYRAYTGTEPRCALYFPLLQEFVEV
ncbi:MAG: UvrD-helicase domain-containing protein [Gammaproteobacteria bacterium]|nr:UvrD-helicase domain-containing protein [Gammaproteobacteria bacterium]